MASGSPNSASSQNNPQIFPAFGSPDQHREKLVEQLGGKGVVDLTSQESTFLVQTHLKAQNAVHSSAVGFRPSDEVEKIRRKEKQNHPQAAKNLFFEETVITEKGYSDLTYGVKPTGKRGSGTFFVDQQLLQDVAPALVEKVPTKRKKEIQEAAKKLPKVEANRLSYSSASLKSSLAPQGILFAALKEANQHEESRFDAVKRGPKGELLPIDDKFYSRSGHQDQFSQYQADKYRKVSNRTGATAGAKASDLIEISPMEFELPLSLEDPPKQEQGRTTRSGRSGANKRANNLNQNAVDQISKYERQPRKTDKRNKKR